MDCHEQVNEAIVKALKDPKINGYGPALGLADTRAAVANRYKRFGVSYNIDDIFITSGCSHALQMAISGTVSEGQVVLLPKPGFSIYHTICDHFGIIAVDYPLQPEHQWQIDLETVEQLILEYKPTAWLVNNPSNPCGSVYSKDHLERCIELAQKHNIIIIADEIYEDIVFEGHQYIPMASLSNDLPIITCSGLAKRFMVPGWRLGWIALHDPKRRAESLKIAFFNLAGLILGACTLIQAAVPHILNQVPEAAHLATNKTLQENANVIVSAFKMANLESSIVSPQGTLYMMLKLPSGTDDIKWCQELLAEENVLLLPGTVHY